VPALVTERLTIRRFDREDAAFILRLLNEPSFVDHIADKGVRSLDDARADIESGPVASYRSSCTPARCDDRDRDRCAEGWTAPGLPWARSPHATPARLPQRVDE